MTVTVSHPSVRARGLRASSLRRATVSALAAVLLAACSGNPDAMVASAKEFLAKNDRSAAVIQLKNALQKNPGHAEARFLLGRAQLAQGEFANAEKEFRRALDLGWSRDEVVPLLAEALLWQGRGDKLVELAEPPLQRADAKADFLVLLGDAYLMQQKKEPAVQAYVEARGAVPGHAGARTGEARLLAVNGDLQAALAEVEKVLRDAPALGEAHRLHGELLMALGRRDEAIPAFEAAVKARPFDLSSYQNLVSLLIRADRVDVAQAKLAAMKAAAGNHPLVTYLQAFVDARAGRPKEALDGALQVLRVLPDYLPAQLLAGALQVQKRDFVLAEANLGKVLERAPGHPLAQRLLVNAYVGSGEPARAAEALKPLLKQGASDPAVMNLAGQVYALNGDFTRAEDYFERASKAAPSDAMVRTRLAASRLAAGETDQAFADLEAASQIDPNSIQADVTLIMAHLRRNEPAKATEALKVLEKKRPNDPLVLNIKGGVLLAHKDIAGARKAFEASLAAKPDFLPAATNLARLDMQAKQPDVAKKRFEEFVTKNPKDAQGYLQYAQFLAVTGGKPEETRAVLQRGVTAAPGDMSLRLALVRLLLQTGDNRAALSLAQEGQAAAPDDPAVLELLGRTQLAAGEMQQAASSFNRLVQRQPDSPAPLVLLADAQVAAKELSAAEQTLRKALSLKSDNVDVQRRLFSLLMLQKRTDAAIGIARDIQRLQKTSPNGFVLEGDALAASGKHAEAAFAYDEALKRDRSAGPVATRLHASYVAAGKTAEANKLVAEWSRTNPKDLVLRTYLAERSLGERKYAEAAQQYRQMLEIAPRNPMLLNNLAWTLGQLKDKAALDAARQALEIAPKNPVILDTLGMLQIEFGEAEAGLATLRQAVDLGPNMPQLRLSLANALIRQGLKDAARKELEAALKSAPERSNVRTEIEKVRASL